MNRLVAWIRRAFAFLDKIPLIAWIFLAVTQTAILVGKPFQILDLRNTLEKLHDPSGQKGYEEMLSRDERTLISAAILAPFFLFMAFRRWRYAKKI